MFLEGGRVWYIAVCCGLLLFCCGLLGVQSLIVVKVTSCMEMILFNKASKIHSVDC